MRRYFGIIITIVIVLAVLIGLNAISLFKLDREPESEGSPNRSSYNTGPTGTRAFYQLLEDSGWQVARWRREYRELAREAKDAALVMIGPAPGARYLDSEEAGELKQWVMSGGRLLIVSREPRAQFAEWTIVANRDEKAAAEIAENPDIEKLLDQNSDVLIAQPTTLTRNVRGLAVSRLAARLRFLSAMTVLPAPSPASTSLPTPAPKVSPEAEANEGKTADNEAQSSNDEEALLNEADKLYTPPLDAPVVHLGDSQGAVLADFNYGEGRVIFLSDPFIVANNGIARGANLNLALNLMGALGGKTRRIYFDEALHGFLDASNPLLNYFRGTSVFWVLGQLFFVALLLAWSAGRRFARPLPLPQTDRHSPLEFVGSMANLQQAAQARDLAIENIYPRFKTRLCRKLGLSVKAKPDEIAAALSRRRLNISPEEVRATMHECERALNGADIDDARLLKLVATIRRISQQL